MSLAKYIEQRRIEKEREVRRKIRKERLSTVAKVVAGATVGAGVGILFAPKSGKETREDIVNATKDGVEYVSENVNNAVKIVADKAKEVKEVAVEKYDNLDVYKRQKRYNLHIQFQGSQHHITLH